MSRWAFLLLLITLSLSACTDQIESTLPPSTIPSPVTGAAREIPPHLKNLFAMRCAGCHGVQGEGGIAGTIYKAHSHSARNWATFLQNPKSIDPNTLKKPVEGLTEAEYAAFGEWLARVNKENR